MYICTMTEDQAIQEIISKPKYYVGYMTQSYAAGFVRSWKAGSAKKETIRKFLNTFGYKLKKEAEWGR